jgi:hypothetical protein
MSSATHPAKLYLDDLYNNTLEYFKYDKNTSITMQKFVWMMELRNQQTKKIDNDDFLDTIDSLTYSNGDTSMDAKDYLTDLYADTLAYFSVNKKEHVTVDKFFFMLERMNSLICDLRDESEDYCGDSDYE